MDMLKRQLAPIVDDAWRQIEAEAVRVLKSNLSARQLVDVHGPRGFEFSAVNLGALRDVAKSAEGVGYGVREVLPLVELRVPFELDIWDLDNVARGAAIVETGPVIDAALQLAAFEERALYHGFAHGSISGLAQAAKHTAVALGKDASGYADAVAQAMLTLSDHGVGGPYGLVLGSETFRHLAGDVGVYPLRQRIAKLILGPILHSRVLDGGFLVSLRGGDFELTLGQDVSIGYDHHDARRVSLYFTESFTFRVLAPEAVAPLTT